MRLTPPRRARRRIAGLVMPWMLSRSTLRWRGAALRDPCRPCRVQTLFLCFGSVEKRGTSTPKRPSTTRAGSAPRDQPFGGADLKLQTLALSSSYDRPERGSSAARRVATPLSALLEAGPIATLATATRTRPRPDVLDQAPAHDHRRALPRRRRRARGRPTRPTALVPPPSFRARCRIGRRPASCYVTLVAWLLPFFFLGLYLYNPEASVPPLDHHRRLSRYPAAPPPPSSPPAPAPSCAGACPAAGGPPPPTCAARCRSPASSAPPPRCGSPRASSARRRAAGCARAPRCARRRTARPIVARRRRARRVDVDALRRGHQLPHRARQRAGGRARANTSKPSGGVNTQLRGDGPPAAGGVLRRRAPRQPGRVDKPGSARI